MRDAKYASGANNHLLVSIAQAFGVETDTFGKRGGQYFHDRALAGLT